MNSTEFEIGDWITTLEVELVVDDDGTSVLHFSWDEADPALQPWTDLTDEERSEIMLKALTKGLEHTSNRCSKHKELS